MPSLHHLLFDPLSEWEKFKYSLVMVPIATGIMYLWGWKRGR